MNVEVGVQPIQNYFFQHKPKVWLIRIAFLQDEEREKNSPLKKVSVEEILEAQRAEQLSKENEEKAKNRARLEQGLPVCLPDSYIGRDDMFS